jgi:hypothetical protein
MIAKIPPGAAGGGRQGALLVFGAAALLLLAVAGSGPIQAATGENGALAGEQPAVVSTPPGMPAMGAVFRLSTLEAGSYALMWDGIGFLGRSSSTWISSPMWRRGDPCGFRPT